MHMHHRSGASLLALIVVGCVPEVRLVVGDASPDVSDLGARIDRNPEEITVFDAISEDGGGDSDSPPSQDSPDGMDPSDDNGEPDASNLDDRADAPLDRATEDLSMDHPVADVAMDLPVISDLPIVDAAPPCDGAVCVGECVDLSRSAAHCGSCGHACFAPNDCMGGRCVVARAWERRFPYAEVGHQGVFARVVVDSVGNITAMLAGGGAPTTLGRPVTVRGMSSWGEASLSLVSYASSSEFRWARQGYIYNVGGHLSVSQDGLVAPVAIGAPFDLGDGFTSTVPGGAMSAVFNSDGTASGYRYDGNLSFSPLAGGDWFIGTSFDTIADFGGPVLRSVGMSDAALARIGPTGTHRWSIRVGDADRNGLFDIAVSGAGQCYVGLLLRTTPDGFAVVGTPDSGCSSSIIALSDGGVPLWRRSICGIPQRLAVSGRGTLFVTGTMTSPTIEEPPLTAIGDSAEIMLVAYDSAGALLWSRVLGGAGYQRPNAIAADAAGNVYIAGDVGTSITLGTASLTGAGSSDSFLASFNYAGTLRWVVHLPHEQIQSIAVDPSGALVLAGWVHGATDLAAPDMTFGSGDGAFVARFLQP